MVKEALLYKKTAELSYRVFSSECKSLSYDQCFGSGFNWVSGSGSGLGIRIWIQMQADINYPKKEKKHEGLRINICQN
jgi:hypothetical protein